MCANKDLFATHYNDFEVFELVMEGSCTGYYSGQTVKGQVILETREELINIKFVKVKIKGIGDVHWTERVRGDAFLLLFIVNIACYDGLL